MTTIKVSEQKFQVENTTGYSDATVKAAFITFVENNYGAAAVAADYGTNFSAHQSHAKGEKIRFISK